MPGKIMVIDDEKNITFVIQAMLERAGFDVFIFNESSKVFDFLKEELVDVVITDLYMPDPGGMQVLEHCQKYHAEIPVVIITAYGTVEAAVSALKLGAFDFITKPFDQTELLSVVQKAVATRHQREKEPVLLLQPSTHSKSDEPGKTEFASSMTGSSQQMQEIFKIIMKVAQSPSTVLISGESGTGKELVAYEIYSQSDRAHKPFIKINCAAIPASLIESELFGFEKGAFTGAIAAKPGRFELAHEGTLFLDEVGEMPLEMQAKLLRVLQEQEFERVGGVTTLHVDVRILAATNKDLLAEVKQGRFREDLFYRLNVVPIQLPPLRDRRDDIDPLIRYFLGKFNEKLKKNITGITQDVMLALRGHAWPGNIRQLENVLERMVLMSEGSILTWEDLPEECIAHLPDRNKDSSNESPSLKEIVRQQTQSLEKELIERALTETGGNVTRAAERLGLSRKGLQLKMKELRLKRPQE